MDLTEYTDEDLNTLRIAVLAEGERRARIAQIPAQITSLARSAKEAGIPDEDVRAAAEDGLTD